MGQLLKTRWAHLRAIGNRWWAVVAAIISVFTLVDWIMDKWGSTSAKALWDQWTLHLPFDWRIGVIAVLIVTLLLIIDGSYRHKRQADADHQTAIKGLEATIASIKEELRREKEAHEHLKNENTPKLSAAISQALFATAPGHTEIFFPVIVGNSGAPSGTRGWYLRYKAPSGEVTYPWTRIGTVNIADEAKGIHGTLTDADGICEKTLKPIERGESVPGWIRFCIVGDEKQKEITSGVAELTVHFSDVLGQQYTIAYQSSPDVAPPMYVPGTANVTVGQPKSKDGPK